MIDRFESMPVWQAARKMAHGVYAVTLIQPFARDFGMRDQIQRAAISTMSNIAEGFERNNRKEFIRFLGYSKGSAGEVRSILYAALDNQYVTEAEFLSLSQECIAISQQLSNFIRYLKNYRP